MVTVHDILAGAVLAGIAGVAAFQNLSEGDGGQGLLIRILGGETPERDAAPPPPPGARPGIAGAVTRTVTTTAGGGGTSGSGGQTGGGLAFRPDALRTAIEPEQSAFTAKGNPFESGV